MSVAITCTPASPEAVTDMCMIAVSGGQQDRDPDGTGGEMLQYLEATADGAPTLRSERFVPSKDGDWLWQGLQFPEAGDWTVALKDDSDDSELATLSVTVS